METTVDLELETSPITRRDSHCTPERAKELLEGLCAAYQSLMPVERIAIRDIVGQLARTQFTQEMKQEIEGAA